MLPGEVGRIVYYPMRHKGPDHGRFECQCNRGHGRCTLSAVNWGSGVVGAAAQGRPLGMLASWAVDLGAVCESNPDHKNKFAFAVLLTHERRERARRVLGDLPGGAELLAKERPCRLGEGEEPARLPSSS